MSEKRAKYWALKLYVEEQLLTRVVPFYEGWGVEVLAPDQAFLVDEQQARSWVKRYNS